MGNWRRVHVTGTCSAEDVLKLREILKLDFGDERWGPLHCGGLQGLPNWAAEKIDAVGNLGERDYSVEDVAQTAAKLSMIAPSLSLLIHCGDEQESDKCVNTVRLSRGKAWLIDPQVKTIPEMSEDVMQSNMVEMLQRRY